MNGEVKESLNKAINDLPRNIQKTIAKIYENTCESRRSIFSFDNELIRYACEYACLLEQKSDKIPPYKKEINLNRIHELIENLCIEIKNADYNEVRFELNELLSERMTENKTDLSPIPLNMRTVIDYWFAPDCMHEWGRDSDEAEDWWGEGLASLQFLSKIVDEAKNKVASRKDSPTGSRNSESPMKRLIRVIGTDIYLNNLPTSHVVPIAKCIHTWAAGDPKIQNWGVATWREVHAELKKEPREFWEEKRKRIFFGL